MRMWILLLCMTMALSACASREHIMQNYEEKLDASDGIDASEARIIAQRKIITVSEKRNYKITAPGFISTPAAKKYSDYWFVVFGHNWLSPISTEDGAKTYTELKEARYLVVIQKNTGDIVFAGEYFPKRSPDFAWVFEEHRPWDDIINPPAGIPSQ